MDTVPVIPMHGRAAWRRTLEAKERFLATHDAALVGGVRREIALSWRRSLLSGVDAAATDLPRDCSAMPPERLVRAARPVIAWLADQIAGMPVWAFLADRECRLVSYVAGDPGLIPQLEARGAFPGARFAEDVVGTNGLGTAVEQGAPFIVAGSEHFRAYESGATTAGAPVRDPVTRRLIGLLNVNCPYELTNGLLLPFVTELARSVEERLLADSSAAEQALLAEFVRVSKLSSQAVVALSDDVFIANTAALSLLDGADCELLRQCSLERGCVTTLCLTTGRMVTVRCRPLSGILRHGAAVMILTPSVGSPRTRVTSPGERLHQQLELARATRLPMLLRGERGTGKATLGRRLGGAGPVTVLDAAAGARPESEEWTARLRTALADPAGTVLLLHLDALAPDKPLAVHTASLLSTLGMGPPRARVAATAKTLPEHAELAEQFPVIVDVPPLRERIADIPALVTEIIAELRPRPPRPRCTPAALAALAEREWPGNIRELRQVVATALVRSMSCDITVDDLTGGANRRAHRSHQLSRLERAERQAVITALRDAAWNREAAARDLGISRATIYRKMKRLGIRP